MHPKTVLGMSQNGGTPPPLLGGFPFLVSPRTSTQHRVLASIKGMALGPIDDGNPER